MLFIELAPPPAAEGADEATAAPPEARWVQIVTEEELNALIACLNVKVRRPAPLRANALRSEAKPRAGMVPLFASSRSSWSVSCVRVPCVGAGRARAGAAQGAAPPLRHHRAGAGAAEEAGRADRGRGAGLGPQPGEGDDAVPELPEPLVVERQGRRLRRRGMQLPRNAVRSYRPSSRASRYDRVMSTSII